MDNIHKLNDDKLNNDKLNDDKLNEDKLNDDKLNDDKLNEDKKVIYDKLVFSGGGSKGYAYIGVIKKLDELDMRKNFRYMSGSSIGALFILLYSIGFTYEDLKNKLVSFSYLENQSINIETLLDDYGLDNFSKLNEFFCSLLKYKNIDSNITFLEHYKKTGIVLTMDATCLNTKKGTCFNYKQFPDMPIMIALRASMSLPFIFTCVKYKGLTYIDGGFVNPLIHLSIYQDEVNFDPKTILCFNLYYDSESTNSSQIITNIKDYITEIISCVSNKMFEYDCINRHNAKIINIFSNTSETFSTFDLTISEENKNYLITVGTLVGALIN
jgi:predicted patatin/cPLA2 family phospholipase